jgi:hypothetical protein
MIRALAMLVPVLAVVGCSSENERRLPAPPTVSAGTDKAEAVPGLPPDSVMAMAYHACPTSASDRVAVLTIDPPDDRGTIRSTFCLCRTPVAHEFDDLGDAHESGDDPTTGAGYNLGAEVTAATDDQVTVTYDVSWTDGTDRRASGEGTLNAFVAGSAEQAHAGGLIVRFAYHYGNERSNYCIQRTAGRLAGATSMAALAGRR